MNKKFKGYLSSRSLINGEFETQKIQNLVVREVCKYNSYDLQLSSVEYIMNDCYMILNTLIDNLKIYDGVVFFSLLTVLQIGHSIIISVFILGLFGHSSSECL